mmetsp:Transcript_7215/g.11584  ORF Transcript_7215/g.11584 Transcript_7215/m.11584 type:complete len:91 (-) Transcript_7215:381-653(-)
MNTAPPGERDFVNIKVDTGGRIVAISIVPPVEQQRAPDGKLTLKYNAVFEENTTMRIPHLTNGKAWNRDKNLGNWWWRHCGIHILLSSLH